MGGVGLNPSLGEKQIGSPEPVSPRILPGGIGVTVSDSQRHGSTAGQPEQVSTEMMNVTMDRVIIVLLQQTREFACIGKRPLRGGAAENLRMPVQDFRIVGARLAGMNQKVHLHSVAIGASQYVHQPSFHAGPCHSADY